MTEPTVSMPLKHAIPTDLQRQVENIQNIVPRVTGPPGDLDDEKKRWLIVGQHFLHGTPLGLEMVGDIRQQTQVLSRHVQTLCTATDIQFIRMQKEFKSTVETDLQDKIKNLESVCQHFLNGTPLGLEMVGDIRQQTQVLSRHVQTLCTATDIQFIRMQKEFKTTVETDLQDKIKNLESVCQHFLNGTPLGLEMVGDIRQQTQVLSRHVQTLCTATDIQFIRMQKEFKTTVETDLQDKIKNLESVCQHFLHGTPLGLEMVGDIRQQTQVLSRHVQTLCTATDIQFIRMQKEFKTTVETDLQDKIKNLESVCQHFLHGTPLGLEMVGDIRQQTQVLSRHVQTLCTATDIQFIRMQKEFKTTVETDLQDKIKNLESVCQHFLNGTPLGLEIVEGHSSTDTKPTDIINNYEKNKKPAFIVDDICGKETINMQTLQTWRDYSEKMEKIFKFKLSEELCLQETERMIMLHKYLPDDIIDNIKQVTENVDYFPLLCKLSKDKTSEEVKKLFTAPLIRKKDKIEDIGKEFDIYLSKGMDRNSLKAGFSTLNGTYLKLRGTEYRMIHDKIYKMAAVICGQHLTECFIKYAPSAFIRYHFIFECLTEVHDQDDSIILLKDQEEDYFE
ncbi:unnamed protein product [Mytilus edulis]|uniref:Uncharacterized protein n=1 Tax=Mytilus edulis TaxID=6550 RepID=A0A8S3QPD9_MYTED|nr:unnamed protein product [Mytilus edulis]